MRCLHAPGQQSQQIRSRRVYYIGGFDPRGASYYHRLYKEEARKQAENAGYRVNVGPRRKIHAGQHAWNIEFESQGHNVITDYRFLSWDDIVRQNWESNPFKLLAITVLSYSKFIACGAFARIRKMYRGPFYSGLYPLAILFLIAIMSALAGGALKYLVTSFGGAEGLSYGMGILVMVTCLSMGYKLANRMGVLWLLRTYLFVYAWGESPPEGLDQRITEFAELIARDQQEMPCDEVILVGHSVGSILAVSVLARALNILGDQNGRLSLVTLGQCIPLLSLIPGAVSFREEIKTLAEHPSVPWLDMGARADPLCFSQVNPVKGSGIDSPDAQWPKMHIVRIFKLFPPEKYKRIKRNKLRLHFQYLMSSESQADYDYFMLTAGLNSTVEYATNLPEIMAS